MIKNSTKVKWNSHLTYVGLGTYMDHVLHNNNIFCDVDGTKIKISYQMDVYDRFSNGKGGSLLDQRHQWQDGEWLDFYLKSGDNFTIREVYDLRGNTRGLERRPIIILKPSTWYKFKTVMQGIQRNSFYQWDKRKSDPFYDTSKHLERGLDFRKNEDISKLKSLTDYIYIEPDGKKFGNYPLATMYLKTDSKGELPLVGPGLLGNEYTFTVSTDPDAIDISKYEETDLPSSDNTKSNTGSNDSDDNNDNYVPSNDDDVTPTAPATDNSQKSTPAKTDDSKKEQKPAKNNSAKHNASASSSKKVVTQVPTYTVKHTALVYDRHGKRVKTSAKRFILKHKNGKIKVLDHGKVYKIRGKKYYRIGKNMFIKVANVFVQAPAKKVALKGTAKVAKLRHLRFYNANGKHVKKTAKKRNFRFDRKKTIKGKLYYRVKGTNLWVRANQFKLHK